MGIRQPHRRRGLALLAVSLSLWLRAWAAPPPVATLVVQAGGDDAALVLDGSVQATRQSTLAAQLAGHVTLAAAQAGDRVQRGQLIARIDERDALAALLRAQAGVADARAQWRHAELNTKRNRELHAQGFISQAALDVADTQAQAAQANLQQAQAVQAQA